MVPVVSRPISLSDVEIFEARMVGLFALDERGASVHPFIVENLHEVATDLVGSAAGALVVAAVRDAGRPADFLTALEVLHDACRIEVVGLAADQLRALGYDIAV